MEEDQSDRPALGSGLLETGTGSLQWTVPSCGISEPAGLWPLVWKAALEG